MVGGIGSGSPYMQRPDPSQMADKLFSKLDTKNQGYLEKSDLQSAFDQIAGFGGSTSTAGVEDVFKQLDGNSDGKVTQQDLSDSLKKLTEQFESQFNSMRMQGNAGMGGMGGGLTQDELASKATEMGTADSAKSGLITNLVANFDTADSNGDGKVSQQEARAFNQVAQSNSTASVLTDSGSAAALSGATNAEADVMRRIMQLVQAYGGLGQDASKADGAEGTVFTLA